MDRSLRDEIGLSFWKRITGRQDPSGNRKIASLLIDILMFFVVLFVGIIAGFYINDSLIKPTANVVFHPYIEDHSYLPIMITNGQKPLTNITLKVKTCYMEDYKNFSIPKLIGGEQYPIHLMDNDTLFALDKVFNSEFLCNPSEDSIGIHFRIDTYKVDDELYIPYQKYKQYKCGYCLYEWVLESNEFSDKFSGKFPGPIEIPQSTLEVNPQDTLNVSPEQMVPIGPIEIGFFSVCDLCEMGVYNETICKEYC